MASLVTPARAAAHPAAAALDGTRLGYVLEAASDWVKLYCGRTFTSAVYTEVHDGDGTGTLFVNELPVTDLDDDAAVTILEDDGDTTALEATDFRYSGETGELQFVPEPDGDYNYFPRGFRNVTVLYTAGYSTIPQAVQDAIIEIAVAMAAVVGSDRDPTLSGERLGDYSWTLREAATQEGGVLSPATRKVLAMYRVHGREA